QIESGNIVEIRNECKYLPDSNFWCSSYINNRKVDSGIVYTDYSLKRYENASFFKADSSKMGDTLVITRRQAPLNDLYSEVTEYFLDERLVRSITRKFRGEKLIGYD